MSGVTKAIGKVFKPILSAAKWVLPVVALGAAAIFTGGAALAAAPGILGAIGGLGGAAAGAVTSALGVAAGSTLGTVLTGAISTAVTGSLIGGATSLLTGGKVLKGALKGAEFGALAGGVGAGLGAAFSPTLSASASGAGMNTLDEAGNVVSEVGASGGGGLPFGSLNPQGFPDSSAASSIGASAASRPGMLGEFWENQRQNNFASSPNSAGGGGIGSDLVGGVLKGVGQGISDKAKIDAETDANNQLLNRRDTNYRTGGRGLFGQEALNIINSGTTAPPPVTPPSSLTPNPSNVAMPVNPQPTAPWDYEYVYDPSTKQFQRIPVRR